MEAMITTTPITADRCMMKRAHPAFIRGSSSSASFTWSLLVSTSPLESACTSGMKRRRKRRNKRKTKPLKLSCNSNNNQAFNMLTKMDSLSNSLSNRCNMLTKMDSQSNSLSNRCNMLTKMESLSNTNRWLTANPPKLLTCSTSSRE